MGPWERFGEFTRTQTVTGIIEIAYCMYRRLLSQHHSMQKKIASHATWKCIMGDKVKIFFKLKSFDHFIRLINLSI